MDWLKLKNDILNDPKLRRYFSKSERWDFVGLLCLASKSKIRGVIVMPDDEIAYSLELADEEWAALADKLEERRLIARREDGAVIIVNWAAHQYDKPSDQPEQVRERVARSRELARQRSDDGPAAASATALSSSSSNGVTPCNALVTPCNATDKKRLEESRREQSSSRGGAGESTADASEAAPSAADAAEQAYRPEEPERADADRQTLPDPEPQSGFAAAAAPPGPGAPPPSPPAAVTLADLERLTPDALLEHVRSRFPVRDHQELWAQINARFAKASRNPAAYVRDFLLDELRRRASAELARQAAAAQGVPPESRDGEGYVPPYHRPAQIDQVALAAERKRLAAKEAAWLAKTPTYTPTRDEARRFLRTGVAPPGALGFRPMDDDGGASGPYAPRGTVQ